MSRVAQGMALAVLVLLHAAGAGAQVESPAGPERASLAERVSARLAERDPEVASRVEVSASEGVVLLRGVVRLLEHALQAERIAWTTAGVSDVENELRVVPVVPASDADLARRVREILKTDPRFATSSVRVTVEAGFVRLKGLFEDPAGVVALKHRVASLDGVLHVEIEALLVAAVETPPGRGS